MYPSSYSLACVQPSASSSAASKPPTNNSSSQKSAARRVLALIPTRRSTRAVSSAFTCARRASPATISCVSVSSHCSRRMSPRAAASMNLATTPATAPFASAAAAAVVAALVPRGLRNRSAINWISSLQGPPGLSIAMSRRAARAEAPPLRSRPMGTSKPDGPTMSACSSEHAAGLVAIASMSAAPERSIRASELSHSRPAIAKLRRVRLAFLMSASIRGGTSPSDKMYVHDHSNSAPFLSASSGSPWPTCQSCAALTRTLIPASRAEYTSSIHVLSIVTTEMVMDLGSSSAKAMPFMDAIISSCSDALACCRRTWRMTVTRM